MVRDQLSIYRNKKVFVTGHTGFKGSWLISLLQELGCEVSGYALESNTDPCHFSLLKSNINSTIGDIRNNELLSNAIQNSKAEIVFHLAAQSLVRASYANPIYTYDVNVMGSLHVLNAVRSSAHVRALVMVTTDKVYENVEMNYSYVESDRLGGYDMYSSSKACCEILIDSFRNSFCNLAEYNKKHNLLIASVRAGNVIGGGDWSADRLIPDMVKATSENQSVELRNPKAIRPWQHVLDCLYAYLLLGKELLQERKEISCSWNVAPDKNEVYTVEYVVKLSQKYWSKINYSISESSNQVHEAQLLMLDNSKIKNEIGWKPLITTEKAVEDTIYWYKNFYENNSVITHQLIKNFLNNSWN